MAVITVLVLAGCGTARHPAPAPHAAGEPAVAPVPRLSPAGTTAAVGAAPEGIAVDPVTGAVAVAVRGPDRLQLLDPVTLAVRHTVALPGHARHLQAFGGRILVPCEDADTLVVVGAASGAVLSSTRVGRQPHDATQAATGAYVVGDEFGKALSVVADGRVIRTVYGTEQPGGVAPLTGSLVASVDVLAYTVAVFDIATGARVSIAAAGAGPTHLDALDPATVVVADTRGNALLVYATAPLRQVFRLPLAGTPYGLAVDTATRTVWTTLTGTDQLVGMRWDGRRLAEIARYPTVQQPNTVAVSASALYVTGTVPGTVQRIGR